jgi:hypothetical protein
MLMEGFFRLRELLFRDPAAQNRIAYHLPNPPEHNQRMMEK